MMEEYMGLEGKDKGLNLYSSIYILAVYVSANYLPSLDPSVCVWGTTTAFTS